jgi:hypothetical protein
LKVFTRKVGSSVQWLPRIVVSLRYVSAPDHLLITTDESR